MSWLRCQKIAGLEYWFRLLFNFTPVSVLCTPSVDRALNLSLYTRRITQQ